MSHELGESRWDRWSTTMHLLVTAPAVLHRARAIVDTELDAVEAAASRFRPDSEICALAAADGRRTPVSPVLAALIDAALTAARATDGDVDPTVGRALISLGYDRDIAEIGADTPALASVAVPVAWTDVDFDGRSVRMPSGTWLDLGATAKAFAADRCARRVREETGTGVLVNLGGDIATAGTAPAGDWQIEVQDDEDEPASRVALGGDAGLATSSTRRRRWRRADQTHHHIIDPHTGSSAEPVWRSVSVAAQTCLAANTVSTAAIVRGRRAPEWIASLGVPARLVDRDGVAHMIGGWPG